MRICQSRFRRVKYSVDNTPTTKKYLVVHFAVVMSIALIPFCSTIHFIEAYRLHCKEKEDI